MTGVRVTARAHVHRLSCEYQMSVLVNKAGFANKTSTFLRQKSVGVRKGRKKQNT